MGDMNITKCDICKKAIKDYGETMSVRFGFDHNEFCKKCGLPVLKFLKKHKIIKRGSKNS